MTVTEPSLSAAPARSKRSPLRWWREFGRPPRIMGLDVARALAVLGMVGAHIGDTGYVELWDLSTWGGVIHGRSSILFAVLAGVSIALMTGRERLPAPESLPSIRLGLLGRGAVIFAIGVALEMLSTPIAVILTVYGLLYVLAIPFLRWTPVQLLMAAGALALAGPPLLAGLQAVTLGASGPGISLVLFGTYPVTVWMALVLAGMALGRMPLSRVRVAASLLVAGVVLSAVGYGVAAAASVVVDGGSESWSSSFGTTTVAGMGNEQWGIPGEEVDLRGMLCDDYGDGYLSCYPAESGYTEGGSIDGGDADATGWAAYPQLLAEYDAAGSMLRALVSGSPHSGGTAEIVGSGGFAIAVIGLCLLASRPLRWALLPLAALGSMPLTAYAGHIVAIYVIAGPLNYFSGNDIWGWFSLGLVVSTTLWAMLWGRGPLERLVGRAASAMSSIPR